MQQLQELLIIRRLFIYNLEYDNVHDGNFVLYCSLSNLVENNFSEIDYQRGDNGVKNHCAKHIRAVFEDGMVD